MASGYHPVFGSFTTSCLDDIPFKIGTKFLPPNKVILPPGLELTKPSVTRVDTEYTFEVEEAVLKWSEERERQIEEQRRYEEERQAAVARQAAESAATSGSGGNENISDGQDASESQSLPDYENLRLVYPRPPPRPAPPSQKQPQNPDQPTATPLKPYFVAVPNPLLANISNDILKPIPISQRRASEPNKKEDSSSRDSSSKAFDVSLFEKEDDPFDNIELQTINDMEELKTVLEETNKSSPSPQFCLEHSSSETQLKQVVDTTDVVDLDSAQRSDIDKNIPDYENIEQLRNKSQNIVNTTTSDSDLTKLPPVPPRRDLVGRSLPLPPIGRHRFSNESDTGNTNMCSQNVSQSWNGDETTLESHIHVQQDDSSHNVHYDNVQARVQNPIPKPPRHFKYSRHMDDTDDSTTDTGTETGVVNILPKSGDNGVGLGVQFRNTRSNPEINHAGSNGIARPRPVPAPRRSKSPPSRPSSEQSWNRYSPLPPPPPPKPKPVSTSSPSPVVSPHAMPSPSPVEPNQVPSSVPVKSPEEELYDQLSNEAKAAVDNLVSMGFNKGRVARGVKSLGSDEKEVVEYLCLVDQLTEKGYNVNLAETALLLFNNNSNKASLYLELFSQLRELGFNGEKIKEALVKTNIDREQTLDILTATS